LMARSRAESRPSTVGSRQSGVKICGLRSTACMMRVIAKNLSIGGPQTSPCEHCHVLTWQW
jgi:hypothetical protein